MRVAGPRGDLEERKARDIEVVQEDGQLIVTRPTDRAEHRALHGLTRTLIANMVEGVTTGFTKTLEIQGVGYRAAAQGHGPRARARLLAPGADQGAGGHRVRGARSRRASSSRASTSSRSARSPPSSASSGRRSPTRARASATRASTSPGRSGSAHEHRHRHPQAPAQAPPPRPREGARHGRAAADLRVPLQPRHLRPAHRRRRRPHAGRRQLDRGRPARRSSRWSRPAAPAACWPSARRPPASRPRCSTAAATSYHGRVKALAEGAREGGLTF